MVIALNANEVIPAPIPASQFGMIISGVEKLCGTDEISAVGDIFRVSYKSFH